jgi:hypothetical protein
LKPVAVALSFNEKWKLVNCTNPAVKKVMISFRQKKIVQKNVTSKSFTVNFPVNINFQRQNTGFSRYLAKQFLNMARPQVAFKNKQKVRLAGKSLLVSFVP